MAAATASLPASRLSGRVGKPGGKSVCAGPTDGVITAGSPQLGDFLQLQLELRLFRLGIRQAIQLDGAVPVFDQGGAGLDPVTAVEVVHFANLADLGMVDMPAYHPVQPALHAFVGDGLFKVADKADRGLDLVLEVSRQRPVAITVASPPMVQPAI